MQNFLNTDIDSLEKFRKYLSIEKQAPNLDFLKTIVPKHLEMVPYESLSKILYTEPENPRFLTLSEYVDRMIEFGFGGTCFANNFFFAMLLDYLGFEVELNAVDTEDDSDSHVTCKVRIDGKPYIVDFGNMTHFSGPFPLVPGKVLSDIRGDNRFVFTPRDDAETYSLEFFRDEKLIRKHLSKSGSKDMSYFDKKILHTLRPDAYWMQIFCVCKHVGDTTVGVWNKTFFKQMGTQVEKRSLNTVEDLRRVLSEEMSLPHIPVSDILAKMKSYSGVTLFEH